MVTVMCLIIFAYRIHPEYPLILAANRDEFYNRPASPLSFWKEAPDILAGRDLKSNGTWLGVNRRGQIAAVTNFRDPYSRIDNAPSRGLLTSDFLKGCHLPENYRDVIISRKNKYNGFNLIFGNADRLIYCSNRGRVAQEISPGLYGLSNHLLNTSWPKVEKGKACLKQLLSGSKEMCPDDIFDFLGNRSYTPDNLLPDTGVGQDWERTLSSIFVVSPTYGTRNSSILFFKETGEITFLERNFDSKIQGRTRTFRFWI
jgi:uncharacterized protein with NRDE domain